MSFAIIRGSNGRRHEVDFGDAEIEVDIAIGNETVQITSKPSMIQPHPAKGASPPWPSRANGSRQLWVAS